MAGTTDRRSAAVIGPRPMVTGHRIGGQPAAKRTGGVRDTRAPVGKENRPDRADHRCPFSHLQVYNVPVSGYQVAFRCPTLHKTAAMVNMTRLLPALIPLCCQAQFPVACYPFTNGSGADVTGNGFNGVVTGAVSVQDRTGAPNSALSFNGISDHVDVGPYGNMISADEFSVSFWLKPAGSNSDAVILAVPDDINDRLSVAPHYNHNGANTVFWDLGDIFNGGRASIIPYPFVGDWAHWVFVHSAEQNRMAIYVNGTPADLEQHHSGIADRTRPVSIGGGLAYGGADFFFHGVIDDVQFYDVALSDAFVADLYAAQADGWTCSQVGVQEVTAEVPARFGRSGDNLFVDWSAEVHAGIVRLIDLDGRTVIDRAGMRGARWELPLNSVTPGLYIVQCLVDGRASVGRVVVE